MFLVLAGWLVIVVMGFMVGLIFNKIIIDKEILRIFNISLALILLVITVYFIWTIKNLL